VRPPQANCRASRTVGHYQDATGLNTWRGELEESKVVPQYVAEEVVGHGKRAYVERLPAKTRSDEPVWRSARPERGRFGAVRRHREKFDASSASCPGGCGDMSRREPVGRSAEVTASSVIVRRATPTSCAGGVAFAEARKGMLYRFPEILTPKHRLAGLYPVRMSPLANSPAAAHYHAPREQVPGLPLSSRAANGT